MPVRMNPKIPKKIRLDYSLYCNPGWIYSITIVANYKRPYFLNDDLNKDIIECLKLEKGKSKCKVFVYCLMPEHFHFLSSPNSSENSIINFVNLFKGKSTINFWKYGIRGSLWQRRWYDHILREDENIEKAGEYILSNPVRRGLVENWKEYPYSGFIDALSI